MGGQTGISDAVVAVAMERITRVIGGAHQDDVHLVDARDRATVIEALAKLSLAGHPADPSEIRAWALENNWRADAADQLHDYAERTIDPDRPSPRKPRYAGGTRLKDDIVEQWREEARQRG